MRPGVRAQALAMEVSSYGADGGADDDEAAPAAAAVEGGGATAPAVRLTRKRRMKGLLSTSPNLTVVTREPRGQSIASSAIVGAAARTAGRRSRPRPSSTLCERCSCLDPKPLWSNARAQSKAPWAKASAGSTRTHEATGGKITPEIDRSATTRRKAACVGRTSREDGLQCH